MLISYVLACDKLLDFGADPWSTFLQLFENQSVVEYWENFASHAFENTTRSVYSHCVLLKPSGAPVPTTFCFSIRRDLFDLPSMVIGTLNFFEHNYPVVYSLCRSMATITISFQAKTNKGHTLSML